MENSALLGPAAPEHGWVPAPRYLLRRDRVMHALKNIQPCKILEIGCGAGMLLQELAARGFECHALETSSDARVLGAKLAAEARKRIEFHAAPENNWDNSFSLLMAFEVLEHIEDDASAVARWHTWLAPDAKLILSVPAHQKRWNARDVWAGHVRRYERQELVRIVESAGFIVESVDCYGFPLANILEKIGERRYKKHERVQVDQSVHVRDANTAQSGIDRSADAKWYPFLRSPLGRIAIWTAMLIQRPFRNTESGNGYVLVARKA